MGSWSRASWLVAMYINVYEACSIGDLLVGVWVEQVAPCSYTVGCTGLVSVAKTVSGFRVRSLGFFVDPGLGLWIVGEL